LALAIIGNYVSKNSVDFAILTAAFPDECQGGIHGVFRKKEEVKDFKRYYMNMPITLIDGNTIVVSNQWGIDNIPGLINRANALGYKVNPVNVTSSFSTPKDTLASKSEINIAVEIVSTEEYDTNYAFVNLALNVNSQLVENFNSKCEYNTLYALVSEITSTHTEEILIEAHNQSGLDELLENDFDWCHLEPIIRVTEINNVNLSALYDFDCQTFQVAAILGVDEDEAEDRAMSLRDDLRRVVDRELLFRLVN
jgi:hypothetical protein